MSQQLRPPVVTIMGHVDHGKTSLLDAIRKTSVAAKESGGITQHIGAYRVQQKDKFITFIDTPGHAAFSQMRSRGASVTDIVVLVVSAVEGVKPQTVESIQHIKKAGVQYLVALTKMDLPEANPEMVKAQLTEHEVFVEGYGGDIVVVPVSAKSGEGLDKLLEMIALIAEMAELKADPKAHLEAVVVESKTNQQRGSVGTVLVRQGTLRVGDTIYAENTDAKVKAMFDEGGKPVKEAGPSTPVEVLGWNRAPAVGSKVSAEKFSVVAAAPPAAQAATTLSASAAASAAPPAPTPATPTVPTAPSKAAPVTATTLPVASQPTQVEQPTPQPSPQTTTPTATPSASPTVKLQLILKSDVTGTLEALTQAISADEVEILSSGIGDINDADILLAEATHALILGFKVKPSGASKKLAEALKVKMKVYDVIYDLIEDVQKQVLKLIEPTINEEELGVAEVVATFDIKGEKIAGCKVKTGEITRGQQYHLKRDDTIIADPKMKALKRGKEDIDSAKAGTECGISFRNFTDIQIGDVISAYRVKED